AQADADAQRADFRVLIRRPGITGDIQTRDGQHAAGARDFHDLIQHRRRLLLAGVLARAVRLEADAVDRAIHLRHADDQLDLLAERRRLGQVDRLASETLRLLQA